MPDINTYSPRKVTDQNADLLPSTHDPKKRTTYVQISMSEPEIKEAIRNWVRAQIPVDAGDELPVKIIAGRGENGHSAEVIVTAGTFTVTSPERPTAPMATFEAAAEEAARRNAEHDDSDDDSEVDEDSGDMVMPEALQNQETAQEAAGEPEQPEASAEPETVAETVQETPAAPAEPPKKSSLFDKPKPSPTAAAADAANAAAAPPQTEHSKPAEEPAGETSEEEPPKPKAKSIFDR